MEKSSIFYGISQDIYKIGSGFRPIPMNLLIDLITVEVSKCTNFLGESTGWTKYEHKPSGLILTGGIVKVNGVVGEYLESIQYGKNLENRYNNFVNPFFLFPILKDEGKDFFITFFDKEINAAIGKQIKQIDYMEHQLLEARNKLQSMMEEVDIYKKR